jgi:hypothetical protein
VLASAALVAGALGACGSSSDQTIAEVRGASPISNGLLDHWIRIESVLAYDTIPKAPIPKGVVPVPPHYGACIAFLGTKPFLVESGKPKETHAQLKARCGKRYEEIKQKALSYMIAARWVRGELAQKGIHVSQNEVAKAIRNFKIKDFEHPQEFAKYMIYAGLSPQDLHFIIEITTLETSLEERDLSKKGFTIKQRQQALAGFIKRWTVKTTCKPGYRVPGCREYRGSGTAL